MIPFYFLSLLLIALPSTTADASYSSYISMRPLGASSNATCGRYKRKCISSSPGNQPPRESLSPPPPQSQSPKSLSPPPPQSQSPESLSPPPQQSQSQPPSQSQSPPPLSLPPMPQSPRPPLSLPPKPSPPLSPSPPPSLPILLTNRSGSSKPSSMIIIVGTLGSVAFCSLVVVVAGCFFRKRLRTVKERYHSKRQKKKVGNDMKKTVESLQFRLGPIETATNKFSDDNKLGEGGFGAVFKGTLGNGHEIAVKRLSKSSTQGVQEFQNEVVLVAKLQHRNLVRLLGFCLEGEETLLVYEYVPNKSLDKFLFEPKKREQLDWSRRCMIIGGIARGILYLHEDSRLRVIHRDLKASNILLDGEMNPKISDFGMAKMFGIDGQTQGNTERVVGTYGYMAPEYAIEGIYSVKSDVFSFGVLLLEITTGRKNFLGFNCRFPTLLAHAWQSWNEGKGLDLIDPILLKDSCRPDQVLRYIHIGLLCVQEDANSRPTMSSVVLMLKTETISLPKPERPAFFTGRSANMQDQIAANSCTINGLTISDDLPR
ncbi:unnamed protein product [Malus baccata var. baccata]